MPYCALCSQWSWSSDPKSPKQDLFRSLAFQYRSPLYQIHVVLWKCWLQGCSVSFPVFAPHRLSPPYSRLQKYARIRCLNLERSSVHLYFTLINHYYVNHIKQQMRTQTSELKAYKQFWVQKLLLSKYDQMCIYIYIIPCIYMCVCIVLYNILLYYITLYIISYCIISYYIISYYIILYYIIFIWYCVYNIDIYIYNNIYIIYI